MLPPATIPAALLGFDSNINVLSRLSRFLRRLSLDDIKENWATIFPLLVATAGAVVNFKVQMDTFSTWPKQLTYTIAAGSALSILNRNSLFTIQQIHNMQGNKDKPIIRLLIASRDKLKKLAADNPTAYIDFLSQGLLKQLTAIASDDSQEQVNNILLSYLALFRRGELFVENQHQPSCCCTGRCICNSIKKGIISSPALIASIMNFDSGLSVPQLWGAVSLTSALSLSTGILFGSSSFLVNAAINIIAVGSFTKMLTDIYQQGLANYLRSFTWKDRLFLLPKLYVCLGYGFAKGGMAWTYPYPDLSSFNMGYIEAPVAAAVFTAVASLALKGFLNTLDISWHRKLLDNAIAADDLKNYFTTLNPEQQDKLITLLHHFLSVAFDAQLEYFNHLSNDDLTILLPATTQEKLQNLEVPATLPEVIEHDRDITEDGQFVIQMREINEEHPPATDVKEDDRPSNPLDSMEQKDTHSIHSPTRILVPSLQNTFRPLAQNSTFNPTLFSHSSTTQLQRDIEPSADLNAQGHLRAPINPVFRKI
jgi:hypothetical protein